MLLLACLMFAAAVYNTQLVNLIQLLRTAPTKFGGPGTAEQLSGGELP